MFNSLKKRFIAKEGRGAATRDPATTTTVVIAAAPRDQRDGAAVAHSPRDTHVANTASMSALPLATIGPRGQPLRHNLAFFAQRIPSPTRAHHIRACCYPYRRRSCRGRCCSTGTRGSRRRQRRRWRHEPVSQAGGSLQRMSCAIPPPFIRCAAGTLLSSTFLGRGLSCVPTARNSGFICTVDGSWLAERQTEG